MESSQTITNTARILNLGTKQKYSILANDLVRRLSNMGQSISLEEYVGVVDNYTYKLKASG